MLQLSHDIAQAEAFMPAGLVVVRPQTTGSGSRQWNKYSGGGLMI